MQNNIKLITYMGQTRSIMDWSRLTGIRYGRLQKRLADGWSVEAALTYPRSKRFHAQPVSPFRDALLEYQRDLHAQHRQLQRTIRTFIGDIEKQMAELRHQLDHMVDEQIHSQASNALPGVVTDFAESASDRCLPSTQASI